MNRTLYVSDLDGTLLRSDRTTSGYTNRVIGQLTEKGIVFSYATARSVYTSRIVTRGLNAAIPVITRASSVLPFLFTGSLLLETFFGIPGLGFAGVDALNNADLQLLKALVIVSALLFVLLNLLADLAYAWADPRIRLE